MQGTPNMNEPLASGQHPMGNMGGVPPQQQGYSHQQPQGMPQNQGYPQAPGMHPGQQQFPGQQPPGMPQQQQFPGQQPPGMPQQQFPGQQPPGMPHNGYPPQQPGMPPMQGYAPQPGMVPPQNYNPYYQRHENGRRQRINGALEGYDGGYLGDILEDLRGLYIKQETDWAEVITGCERQNKYKIMDLDDKKGGCIFKAKEKSGCCARNCMPGSVRPFEIKVENKYDRDRIVLWCEKDYSMECFCLNRPVFRIFTFHEQTNQKIYIGKVKDAFDCGSYVYELYTEKDQLAYSLKTPVCQLAMCCKFPCDDCQKVDFQLFNGQNQPLGIAKRRGKGFIKNALTDADKFEVMFTATMPWNHRCLLMCAMLFIDYRMFEDNNKKKKNNGELSMIL